jgi:galactonate dehydratase
MSPIKSLEHFRVMPRWLFVKVTDEDNNCGWGEATLEGHSEAVEGALDALRARFVGVEADGIENIWQKAYRQGKRAGFLSAST